MPPTGAVWCTAMSSRATCCWISRATGITPILPTSGLPTPRRPRVLRMGSSWGRSTMSRPSRSAVTSSTAAPTSTRWDACCSNVSPGRCRSAIARRWQRSSLTFRNRHRSRASAARHFLPRWTRCSRGRWRRSRSSVSTAAASWSRRRTTRSGWAAAAAAPALARAGARACGRCVCGRRRGARRRPRRAGEPYGAARDAHADRSADEPRPRYNERAGLSAGGRIDRRRDMDGRFPGGGVVALRPKHEEPAADLVERRAARHRRARRSGVCGGGRQSGRRSGRAL